MNSDPLIGKKLGDYRIVEQIGRGGMADIYKGHNPKTNRYVAIKFIGRHLPADPALTTRFRREARAAASLHHPHIITVHEFGEYGGGHYMVMDYIEGTNLQGRMKWRFARNRGFKPQEIVTLIDQIASALDSAHRAGIIHRDVKPANILLSKKRGAVLTDFGLVMLRDRVSQQTRGESFGTPEYIAPEQAIDSRAATARSDVYSLGVLLYELTTRHLPFDAESALSMALMHIGEEPTPPRQHVPDMPVAVEAVILRAMAKEPRRRYASAGGLAAALRTAYGDLLRARPSARPKPGAPAGRLPFAGRWRLIAGGFIVLLLLGVGLFLLRRGSGDQPASAVSDLADTPTPTGTTAATAHLPGGTAPGTPIATPTATATTTPTSAATPTATSTARPTATATATAAPTATATSTARPTATATAAAAPTSTTAPVSTVAPTATATSEPTATPTPTAVPEPTPVPTLSAGDHMLRPADQMTMHFVSAGPFLMGSTPDDADSRPHEQPQHQVTLSPFWLDQTEVTNAQYQLCVAAGACEPPVLRTFFDDPTYADHPIVYVTWDHATDYCAWLASETGWPVALPTEAQWEKAAAWDPGAQLHRRYPWGDQPPGADHANLNTSGLGRTASVGSYPDGVSFYGLLDLAGNVWEWVADWYDPHYYDTPDLPSDPTGPTSGSQRVMRGGSYGFGAVEARTAHRTAAGPQASGVALGFRCAVNAQELP